MTDIEHNATGLLDNVTDIIKRYEAQWQRTGEKYNLFKVADIAHKEVIMCRVLADLMNPQGKHCQGSRYLRLFWETIAFKLSNRLALDIENTRITTEYVIDENRRIGITLEDGVIFVPIEVKIWAGTSPSKLPTTSPMPRRKTRRRVFPYSTSPSTATSRRTFHGRVLEKTAMCVSRSKMTFLSGLRRVREKIHRKQRSLYRKILDNSSRR